MNFQYEDIKAELKRHSTKEGVFNALCDAMRSYRSTAKGVSSESIEKFKQRCHEAYQEYEKTSQTLPKMDYAGFTAEFDRVDKSHEGDVSYSARDSIKYY